jgi:hypothetical protein
LLFRQSSLIRHDSCNCRHSTPAETATVMPNYCNARKATFTAVPTAKLEALP